MTHLSISLLGPFVAELDGQPLSGIRSGKIRALLAYLAVEAQRPWARSTLAYLFWPDFSEKSAQSNLRNALSNLRHSLDDRQMAPRFLLVSADTVQFQPGSHGSLDVAAFRELAPQPGEQEEAFAEPAGINRLQQALALYRGDFLDGFSVASAPFEEWVLVTREQLRQKLLQTVRLLAMAHTSRGEFAAAAGLTRRWIELEPWEEAAHRQLMQILAAGGQRSAALVQYEACRRRLGDELGIDPEPATIRLYEQIRAGLASSAFPGTLSGPQSPAPASSALRTLPRFLTSAEQPGSEPSTFVARRHSLTNLEAARELAAAGQGTVRFVTGEPGIGKSVLLAEFSRRALAQVPGVIIAGGHCSAFTGQGDPYFPFLSITRLLTGEVDSPGSAGIINQEHARRLWGVLPETIAALLDSGPALLNRFVSGPALLSLARMHSGVTTDRLNQLQMAVKQAAARPAQRPPQAALCEQFAQVMLALAQRRPLILIVDDLQWIDPGSVALLFHLGRRLASSRILLLGAYRPEEVVAGSGPEPHPLLGIAQELKMAYGDIEIDLMDCEGAAFIDALLDSEPNSFGDDFRTRLNQRTSGNPLFTIELLRGMQLRGEIRRNDEGRWEEVGRLNWETLPARVEAGIARRLAYLSPECRELLAVASVEGERFTAEVAGGVLQRDPQQVTGLLSGEASKQHQLVVPHSLIPVDGQQLALYRFRHALFQTYLYTHLDLVEQADLHGRVGENLERLYQPSPEKFPEIAHALARHFSAAGATGKAVHYYAAAGKNALRLSAAHEAVAHLNKALELLQTLPPSPSRNGQELDLLLGLGPALTATRGWAPPEMGAAYQRAEELLEQIDDNAQLIPALFLLATFRIGRSEHDVANRLSERATRLAHQTGDPLLISLANLQVPDFYQGNFRKAERQQERAAFAPDLTHQSLLAKQFGLAPAVIALAYLAECSWILGFPEQSERAGAAARELAAQLQHPMTTCYVLGRACWLAALRRDRGAVATLAAALLPIAQQYRLHNFALAAGFHQRWAVVQGGLASAETLGEMQEAMEDYRATGTVLNLTSFLALFAQACGIAGQVERGLAAAGEGVALGRQTGERWYEAEALRIKGELLRQQGAAPVAEARACFEEARETAAIQGAAALELRATLGLCRHWPELSGNREHLQALVAILDEQSGGVETPDLQVAKAFLAPAAIA